MAGVCCRFLPGEQRVVDKEQQLAETAEHDYDRYKLAPLLTNLKGIRFMS